MSRDVYAVLGVEPDASQEELGDAFRALASDLHPDRHLDAAVGRQDQIAAKMAEVTDAWRQVSTPERREAYDLVHARQLEPAADVPASVRADRPAVRRRPDRPLMAWGRRWSDRILRPAVLVVGAAVLAVAIVVAALVS